MVLNEDVVEVLMKWSFAGVRGQTSLWGCHSTYLSLEKAACNPEISNNLVKVSIDRLHRGNFCDDMGFVQQNIGEAAKQKTPWFCCTHTKTTQQKP